MMNTLAGLGIWNWFILGGVLLGLELIAPGTFMLWLGLSAIAVGLISLAIVWPWQAQLVAFAVLSIASIVLWRRFGAKARRDPRAALPQPAGRGFRRPGVHAGKADRRRVRLGPYRRHRVAGQRDPIAPPARASR